MEIYVVVYVEYDELGTRIYNYKLLNSFATREMAEEWCKEEIREGKIVPVWPDDPWEQKVDEDGHIYFASEESVDETYLSIEAVSYNPTIQEA